MKSRNATRQDNTIRDKTRRDNETNPDKDQTRPDKASNSEKTRHFVDGNELDTAADMCVSVSCLWQPGLSRLHRRATAAFPYGEFLDLGPPAI